MRTLTLLAIALLAIGSHQLSCLNDCEVCYTRCTTAPLPASLNLSCLGASPFEYDYSALLTPLQLNLGLLVSQNDAQNLCQTLDAVNLTAPNNDVAFSVFVVLVEDFVYGAVPTKQDSEKALVDNARFTFSQLKAVSISNAALQQVSAAEKYVLMASQSLVMLSQVSISNSRANDLVSLDSNSVLKLTNVEFADNNIVGKSTTPPFPFP